MVNTGYAGFGLTESKCHLMMRVASGIPATFIRMAELLGGIPQAMADFVYPPTCLLCRCELTQDTADTDAAFCETCRGKLCPADETICRRCGARVGPFTDVSNGCILCRREGFAFDEVIRLGLYRDELRAACLQAKNPGGALLGQRLADLLVDLRRDEFASPRFSTVIPVPEHWLKRITRPQYAAETIARQVAARLKVRLATGILAKPQQTPKQARSSPSARRQQQKGAFRVGPQVNLSGQTILLVDDILTTGATVDAAARVLKRSGADRVVVAVLAVSPPTA